MTTRKQIEGQRRLPEQVLGLLNMLPADIIDRRDIRQGLSLVADAAPDPDVFREELNALRVRKGLKANGTTQPERNLT